MDILLVEFPHSAAETQLQNSMNACSRPIARGSLTRSLKQASLLHIPALPKMRVLVVSTSKPVSHPAGCGKHVLGHRERPFRVRMFGRLVLNNGLLNC